RRERREQGLRGVDGKLPVNREIRVGQTQRARIPARLESGGNRSGPGRGRRGDQPLMVEKRTSVGGVAELVAKRVLLRKQALGKARRIEVAQDQARVIAPRHELVQVAELRLQSSVIDLKLLVVEAMNDVARLRIRRDVVAEVVRNQRQGQRLSRRESEL